MSDLGKYRDDKENAFFQESKSNERDRHVNGTDDTRYQFSASGCRAAPSHVPPQGLSLYSPSRPLIFHRLPPLLPVRTCQGIFCSPHLSFLLCTMAPQSLPQAAVFLPSTISQVHARPLRYHNPHFKVGVTAARRDPVASSRAHCCRW